MLSLLVALSLSQTQPAVRRSTPLTDDPGMVVRQTGTVNVNCLSGCTSGVQPLSDGGLIGSVNQGTTPWLVAGADGGAVQISGSISATNPSVSTTGAAVPGSATLIGGTDGTNLIAPYVITTTPDAGDPGLVVRVVGGISGGGSGGAVTQGSTPWLVASSDAGILPVTVENTVTVTGTVAATQSGTWNVNNVSGTVSLPTGASTSALQTTGNTSLSSIDGKTPALGQTTMAGSVPVAIASNQSAVPVSGTVTATGTVTANQGTPASTANRWPVQMTDGTDLAQVSAAGAVLVDGSATTQPVSGTVTANAGTGTFAVSAASLPLPSGAATASNQTTLGAQTTRINDGTDTALITAAGALVVDGSGSTQPVSGTVTANAGTGTFTVGQATAANLRAQTSAEGATGSAVPANATHIGARDTAGTLRPVLATDVDTSGSAIYAQGVVLVGPSFGAPLTSSIEATAIPGTQSGLVTREVKKTATSVVGTSVTCATTATAAPASALANRHSVCIYNNGSNTIFIGPTSVTTSNGFPVPPGGSFCDDVNTTQVYSCIVASGTENARVLEN